MLAEIQPRRAASLRWLLAALLSSWFVPMGITLASESSHSKPLGKVVVVLGDSLAAGHGLDPSEAFPALLQEKIDIQGWPDKVVNAGLSGDTTAGGLRRLNWLLRQRIDVLVLELGGNDGLRGIEPETTQANLQAIIDRTRRKNPAVQIIIAGMQMPPNMGREYVEQFAKVFPALAKANKTLLVPFLLEGVVGHGDLNQADRIHPTAEGQKVVADNVWRVLKPVLAPRNPAVVSGAAATGLN
jgi:acyl-CoA thioesterase I